MLLYKKVHKAYHYTRNGNEEHWDFPWLIKQSTHRCKPFVAINTYRVDTCYL